LWKRRGGFFMGVWVCCGVRYDVAKINLNRIPKVVRVLQ
jgi:hypothetical protein